MRKVLFIFLPVVALTLGAGGGWYWWNVLRFLQSTDDAYVQSDVSIISPKVEGYIKKVKVTDNQEVAEGAVLFVIDDRDFKAKVAQAEAAVAIEEASVASYEARLKLQQSMIDQATASVASAEADLDRDQQDYKRYSALITNDFASRQRFEQAQADARAKARPPPPGVARPLAPSRTSLLCCARSSRRSRQSCSRPEPICSSPRTISTTP